MRVIRKNGEAGYGWAARTERWFHFPTFPLVGDRRRAVWVAARSWIARVMMSSHDPKIEPILLLSR